MSYLMEFTKIFKDELALKLFMIVMTISIISCAYSFILGLFFILLVIASVIVSFMLKSSSLRQNQLQSYLQSYFKQSKKIQLDYPERIFIKKGLDHTIEKFFEKLLDSFINNWYSIATDDVSFVSTLKIELACALRKIALRYKNVDYAYMFSTKLLPIGYNHFNQIEHLVEQSNATQKFVDNGNSIHPATLNRRAEIQYLRMLAENLIPLLCTSSNTKCRPAFDLVRELFSNMLLLPLTDLISDPATINMLVILATNPKTSKIPNFSPDDVENVELLENFIKSSDKNFQDGQSEGNEHFFKDQEKLYNFMHYLRNKSFSDVEILKFVLDVDHLNSEIARESSNPIKLTEFCCKAEELLKNYQKICSKEKPKDLQEAYQEAKSILENKWKFDFYKSAEYYKLIYGEREIFITSKPEKDEILTDSISTQKLSTKIRNVMAMKVAVDGIEEDIQVWDATDATMTSPSYYNSMAVKLRKERGQDLENFMQTFYHSVEQEAEIGEDVSAQLFLKIHKRTNSKQKNVLELFQNLFNIPLIGQQQGTSSFVRTPTQSLLYFLAKILKVPNLILRILIGITSILPDSDSLVLMSIRKIVNRFINQEILAYLIDELKIKLFETKPTKTTQLELEGRKTLAFERLEKIRRGLSENLRLLQNPIFNKHLVYSLIDVIIIEGFPELDPHTS